MKWQINSSDIPRNAGISDKKILEKEKKKLIITEIIPKILYKRDDNIWQKEETNANSYCPHYGDFACEGDCKDAVKTRNLEYSSDEVNFEIKMFCSENCIKMRHKDEILSISVYR